MVHMAQTTVLIISALQQCGCKPEVSNIARKGEQSWRCGRGRAAKCAVREKLPFPGVGEGSMDVGTYCLLLSLSHHAQPSMVGWQNGEKDMSPS